MVRFCTEEYKKPKPSNLNDVYSHLTNYAINKTNENFVENCGEDEENAHKRGTISVFSEFERLGVNVVKLQDEIDDIIRLTIISIQSHYLHTYRSSVRCRDERCRCFEILGFDIFIDEKAKPWLLEVNNMPSFSTGSAFDASIKKSVIQGTLEILNLTNSLKTEIIRRQKVLSQSRMSKESITFSETLFQPDVETENAKKTNWRLIFPLQEDHPSFIKTNEALSKSFEKLSKETVASRVRREAIEEKMKESHSNLNKIVDDSHLKNDISQNSPKVIERQPLKRTMEPKISQPKFVEKKNQNQSIQSKNRQSKLIETKNQKQSNPSQIVLRPPPNSKAHLLPKQMPSSRLIVPKINKTETNQPKNDRVPISPSRISLKAEFINQEEEERRLKNIHSQTRIGQSVNMFEAITFVLLGASQQRILPPMNSSTFVPPPSHDKFGIFSKPHVIPRRIFPFHEPTFKYH